MNFEKFYCILKKFVNITKGILLRKSQIVNIYYQTLYLIFDYPYKYYTFKHFEV